MARTCKPFTAHIIGIISCVFDSPIGTGRFYWCGSRLRLVPRCRRELVFERKDVELFNAAAGRGIHYGYYIFL